MADCRCDQGATAAQPQSPVHVPAISIVAVAIQIAANISPRPERRMHQASSGHRSAPCTSTRCVSSGSAVTPATIHAVAAASTPCLNSLPWLRTKGSAAAVMPNTYTSACPGGTYSGMLCSR